MSDAVERAEFLVRVLRATRMRTSSERVMQDDIEGALLYKCAGYKREFALNAADRPDFFVDGIVIEAKLKCAKRTIYRQLERYARHDRVTAIILVSSTFMGLPAEIEGKPVYFVSVGLANL